VRSDLKIDDRGSAMVSLDRVSLRFGELLAVNDISL
jgi:hypothetical protein